MKKNNNLKNLLPYVVLMAVIAFVLLALNMQGTTRINFRIKRK